MIRMNLLRIIGLVILVLVIITAVKYIHTSFTLPNLIDKAGTKSVGTWNQNIWNPNAPKQTPTTNATSYIYQIVDTTENSRMPYGQVFYNAKLVRVYNDGRTEDVISVMRNRFSNILTESNQMLVQYYFPPNSDILYFSFKNYYLTGADNRYHIYRYNVKTDEMKDLFSNRYLTSYVAKSPYNPLIVLSVDDDTMRTYQKLYLVNLENDSARMLVQLGGDETLANTVAVTGHNPSADVYWITPNQVGYGVYQRVGTDKIIFKERRQLPI